MSRISGVILALGTLFIGSALHAESLYFAVVVPPTGTVGPPSSFTVVIELRDADNGNAIVPNSRIPGIPPSVTITTVSGNGTLLVNSVSLNTATVTFQQAYTAAETISLRATATIGAVTVTGISGSITLNPGPYVKVLALFPNETAVHGRTSATGKTGTVVPQSLAVPFPVAVQAVDAYWNIVPTAVGTARMTTVPGGLLVGSSSQAFTDGVANLSVAVSTPYYSLTMVADDMINPGITQQNTLLDVYGSYQFTVTAAASVSAGPPASFNVNVGLIDRNTGQLVGPNAIPASAPNVTIAILEGGVAGPGTVGTTSIPLSSYYFSFAETYTRAATVSIRATATINGIVVTGTSSPITVVPGPYSKVLMLMPWETARTAGVPHATGKTGTPPPYLIQGVPQNITVRTVDSNWNVVTSAVGTARLDTIPSGFTIGANTQAFSSGEAIFAVAFGTSGYNVGMIADDSVNGGVTPQSMAILVFPDFPQYEVTVPTAVVMTPQTFTMYVRLKGATSGQTINFATSTFNLTVRTPTPATGMSLGVISGSLVAGVSTITTQSASRTGTMGIRSSDSFGFFGDSPMFNVYPENHYYQVIVPTYTVFGVPFPFQVIRISSGTGIPVVRSRNLTVSAYLSNGTPIALPARIDLSTASMTLSPQTWTQTYREPNEFVTSRSIYFKVQSDLDGDDLSFLSYLSTNSPIMAVTVGAPASIALSVSSPLLAFGGSATVQAILRDTPEGHRMPNRPINFSIVQGTGTLLPAIDTTTALGATQSVLTTIVAEDDQIYIVRAQYLTISSSLTVTLALPPKTVLTTNGLAVTGADQIIRIKDNTSIGLTATSVVGISSIQYSVDSGGWIIYSSSFNLPLGQHTLTYFASDTFGLQGPVYTKTFIVAASQPQISGSMANYPNPFRAGTEPTILEYTLAQASGVRLRIFNLLGQLVYEKSYSQGSTGGVAGVNQILWDGRNGSGITVNNGGYVGVLQVDVTGERWTRKIAVVK